MVGIAIVALSLFGLVGVTVLWYQSTLITVLQHRVDENSIYINRLIMKTRWLNPDRLDDTEELPVVGEK